jgi:hypothetical protein
MSAHREGISISSISRDECEVECHELQWQVRVPTTTSYLTTISISKEMCVRNIYKLNQAFERKEISPQMYLALLPAVEKYHCILFNN